MGVFHPLRQDHYQSGLHVHQQQQKNGTQLSFCQSLGLPEEKNMDRWGNIVHTLLQQQVPEYVKDNFYVSSLTVRDDFLQKEQKIEITYFHQDPEVDIYDTKTPGLWRKAMLEFSAPATRQAQVIKGGYTGGSELAVTQGTLAGYVDITNSWNGRVFSDSIASALSVLLYGKELALYDGLYSKDPFRCTAGEPSVSLRIANPTVRYMKIAMNLAHQIQEYCKVYLSPLESAVREIEEARRIQNDYKLATRSGSFRHLPFIEPVIEQAVSQKIREKLKKPAEILQTLAPQFPKNMLAYASLPA